MWHVDEGTLHAYLDGALEEYPAAEARRVREHLDACADCRDRLDAERGVREAAASILGLAAPRVETPTFEDLRAYVRAGANRPGRASVRLYRLGWAASVALALGVGWALRGGEAVRPTDVVAAGRGSVTEPASSAVPEAASREAAPSQLQPPSDGVAPTAIADSRSEASTSARSTEPPAVVVAAPSPAPEEPTPAVATVDRPVAAADLVAGLDVEPPIADAEPTSTAEVVVAATDAAPSGVVIVDLDDDASSAQRDITPERRAAPVEVVTSAQVAAPTAGLVLGRTSRGDARDEPAADDDSYSLVVPGLPVLDVRFRGTGTQPEGQVALQLLASGDTLQVIHLPPELGPDSLDPRPESANQLVVQRSTGWIIMRASLADAELMELMTRLLTGN